MNKIKIDILLSLLSDIGGNPLFWTIVKIHKTHNMFF
jgi:hypothetical protein